MAGKMRNSSVHTFQYFFDSKCYPIELKFFEHLPKMKLKGEQKKNGIFFSHSIPCYGHFPNWDIIGTAKTPQIAPPFAPLGDHIFFSSKLEHATRS